MAWFFVILFGLSLLLLLTDYDRYRAAHPREPGFTRDLPKHGKAMTVALNCWSAVKFALLLCTPLFLLYLIG